MILVNVYMQSEKDNSVVSLGEVAVERVIMLLIKRQI